jgi:hypothetical protein
MLAEGDEAPPTFLLGNGQLSLTSILLCMELDTLNIFNCWLEIASSPVKLLQNTQVPSYAKVISLCQNLSHFVTQDG